MRKSYENNHTFKDPETGEMIILGPPTLVQAVLLEWIQHAALIARVDEPLPDRRR